MNTTPHINTDPHAVVARSANLIALMICARGLLGLPAPAMKGTHEIV
jgi:hypothetical protein